MADGPLKDETTVLGLYWPGPAPATASGGAGAVTRRPLPRDAEEYLSWLEVERGRSPRTLAAYRRDLASYQGDVGRRAPASIDEATPATSRRT